MMTMRYVRTLILFGLSVPLLLICGTASAEDRLVQRDWMISLVDSLGLTFGLPDEPTDEDYIGLLKGRRHFRFEAEEVFDRTRDEAAIMSYTNFGPFSGEAWLQSAGKPTTLHLRFTLPQPGSYLVKAGIRGGEHSFAIDGQTFRAESGERFSEVELGTLSLNEGPQEIKLSMTPSGAIDYLELQAPHFEPIMPEQGWQPDKPLTWDVIRTTLFQVFALAELLPANEYALLLEAEALEPLPGTRVVDAPHLGDSSGGLWLRATSGPARIEFPFTLPEGGFYELELNKLGREMTLTINDHFAVSLAGKAFLESQSTGPFFLPRGDNRLSLDLTPGNGIDYVRLTPLQQDAQSLTRRLGLLNAEGRPGNSDLNSLSALLAAFGSTR